MPQCRFCDRTNPAGARRCAGCGAELPTDEAEAGGRERPASAGGLDAVADPLERRVLSVLASQGKIAAIKAYREQTGAGLKEARDAVEALAERYGIPAGQQSGCAALLAVCIGVALAVLRVLG